MLSKKYSCHVIRLILRGRFRFRVKSKTNLRQLFRLKIYGFSCSLALSYMKNKNKASKL